MKPEINRLVDSGSAFIEAFNWFIYFRIVFPSPAGTFIKNLLCKNCMCTYLEQV